MMNPPSGEGVGDIPEDELSYEDASSGHLGEDPDSLENVLSQIDLPAVPDEEEDEDLEGGVRLDDEITYEVRAFLSGYGWKGIAEMQSEDFLELCDRLGIEPNPREAVIALEDLGFSIEGKNYEARALSRAPRLEDIEDESKAETNGSRTESLTISAYLELSGFINDPILRKIKLLNQRADLVEEMQTERRRKVNSIEEYDEQQDRLEELRAIHHGVESQLEELLSIEQITRRRERAFRRMSWLVNQDFMELTMQDFKTHCEKNNISANFQYLAETIAGKYTNVVTSETVIKMDEKERVNAGSEVGEVTRKYIPGIIDQLIEEHQAKMASQSGKTNTDRENEAMMFRRLMQAKAVCVGVFQNDITDRIYQIGQIPPGEFKYLEFVRERLYMHGDTDILDEFLTFMPGSQLRASNMEQLEDLPLRRFSGRTIGDFLEEIDTIISEHPTLDTETITVLMEAKKARELDKKGYTNLAIDAFLVLEKLVYKENHSVRQLISED